MSSSVIISSSRPNNNLIRVCKQVVDDTGAPVGEAEVVAELDDGETYMGHVDPHAVLFCIERPRGGSPAAIPPEISMKDEMPVVIGSAYAETEV